MGDERQDVHDTLVRYCHVVDGTDVEAWATVFTEDGVFAYRRFESRPLLFSHEGRDALRAWFTQHRIDNPVGTQHHMLENPLVRVDGDEATAAAYYLTLKLNEGGIYVASSGRYEDRLVREDDGVWRFRERIAVGVMPKPKPA